jgi:hypothetical protein
MVFAIEGERIADITGFAQPGRSSSPDSASPLELPA